MTGLELGFVVTMAFEVRFLLWLMTFEANWTISGDDRYVSVSITSSCLGYDDFSKLKLQRYSAPDARSTSIAEGTFVMYQSETRRSTDRHRRRR